MYIYIYIYRAHRLHILYRTPVSDCRPASEFRLDKGRKSADLAPEYSVW